MARKPKAKPLGRPPLPPGRQKEQRSIRLPPGLWKRIDERGKAPAVIEQAVTKYLDKSDNHSTERSK